MNITKTVRTAIAVASLAGIIFFISSCKSKGSGTPLVTVESYTGYVYKDSTIAHGQTFNVWIIAQKQGVNDLLETGKFSKSINGGPDSIYQTMVLATTQFSNVYSYVAGDSGTVEKYKFTFGNQDGVENSDSVIITVN